VRTILGAVSMKLHHRYTLDILEEDDEARMAALDARRLPVAGADRASKKLGQTERPGALSGSWLARIRRPQGRKGEVFADILTDFPEKFAERRRLWLLPEGSPAKPGRAVSVLLRARPS
jgi:hypothetical protein